MKTSLVVGVSSSLTLLLAIVVISLVVTLSPNTGGAINYQNYLIDRIDPDSIDKFLRNLTLYPHPAGSNRSNYIANVISKTWKEDHGLQNVNILSYDVYLSEADPNNTNYFQISDFNGDELHTSSPYQPPVGEFPQEDQKDIIAFNAFSGNGEVNSTRVIYANYGSVTDFKWLKSHGIEVNASIVIIRYSNLFRGDKIRFAEEGGAIGVILYTDPADAAPQGTNATYPDTVYAPSGGIQLGSLVLQGDLLTPGYPATEFAYHLPEETAAMPKIPVQPVSYEDAYHIISRLDGLKVIDSWQGGLNVTYKYGGSLLNRTASLRIVVSNINAVRKIYNVIGSLTGQEEPDRYVLLGNHHDSWGYGGIDPSSATANMLELTRVFGKMYKDGWRPRRTLVFCSWDAEEAGIIGSTEYAEQFSTALKDRAVVYLNVDMVMAGNYSFAAMGVPQLYDIIYEMAKIVPNPDPEEVRLGNKYLYDTWLERFPNGDTEDPEPAVGSLGTGSDFRAYLFTLGIPSLDMAFTVEPGEPDLPLYHMAYETYELATRIMDEGLYFHQASARMWGLLSLEFSSRHVLPLNMTRFGQFVESAFYEFQKKYKEQIDQLNITMGNLEATVKQLVKATEVFEENFQNADLNDALTLRRFNDAMMLMDRSLLAPLGLPFRPLLNHVLVAPSAVNGYVWETFPGLQDVLRAQPFLGQVPTRKSFIEHMAAVAHHLTMAAQVLTFDLW